MKISNYQPKPTPNGQSLEPAKGSPEGEAGGLGNHQPEILFVPPPPPRAARRPTTETNSDQAAPHGFAAASQ
jgi:hypothetical protein